MPSAARIRDICLIIHLSQRKVFGLCCVLKYQSLPYITKVKLTGCRLLTSASHANVHFQLDSYESPDDIQMQRVGF